MQDLTSGKPAKVILMFAIPLMLGNMVQQLYNISDTLIVGQTLGVDSLAAVGATGSIQFLVMGFVQGFSSGMAIITAQRYGAQNVRGVRESYAASIVAALIMSLILTVVSLVFIDNLMHAMQMPAAIYGQAKLFIGIILAGTVMTMGYNVISNALRAVGDSKAPLYYLIIGMIVNVSLELLLILKFHWGVEGAATATVFAQFVTVVISHWHITRYTDTLRLSWSDFKLKKGDLRQHMMAGLPMGFQQSIIAIGSVTLATAVNTLGTDAVAANTAASKVDQISTQLLMSVGVAMATYTAQNFGAGKYDRILEGVKSSLKMSISMSFVLGAIEVIFGRILVTLFVGAGQHEVMDLAQEFFWANGPFYFILSTLFVLRYTLQGLGDVRTPTFAGMGEMVMRTITAFALVGWLGFFGASLANPLAWLGSLLFLVPAWLRMVKRLRQLIKPAAVEENLN
ncbi:MATE family efflux transporter [Weissella paramesenteroides]|uniref:MATE family efflux transporter n=1 Tax=Weissella paramesenteroides TaxID=1249 RepID=UPI0012395A5C|nr:MATE family efflux transporter [Weissella paramesenteroides]KAA8441895.1 MATE family efflux transporter [Weissella paramesenteroides]KAA8442139.1 MATE family efflux transporter [Weissella paramesenteroides]KAA8443532.1 MATE family efflux transporter [Weissella paramesenteroides]KAA8447037.1 MATE family efflux transporter [Weissella paramesenteroides]KAA8450301.1 MATE family efflux transporter [Weissella paramesenteroides]